MTAGVLPNIDKGETKDEIAGADDSEQSGTPLPATVNPVGILLEGVGRIIKGKREFLERLFAVVPAGGHVLL